MDILSPQELDTLCESSQQVDLLAYTWSLLSLSILVVSLRLYSKSTLSRGVTADDYTAVASVIIACIGASFLTKWTDVGLGSHILCLSLAQIRYTLLWSLLSQVTSIIGICLIKISVCLCVLRVIDRVSRFLHIFLWTLIAFTSASHFSQMMLFLVECVPLAGLWDPSVKGKCMPLEHVYLAGYIGFGLDAFTDLICAWIPIFVIMRLQMSWRNKIGICILMGLGSITAGCAVAKAVVLHDIWAQDFTWKTVTPARWAIMEQSLGTVLASLPALKPLFNKAVTAVSTSTKKSTLRQSFYKPRGDLTTPRLPTQNPMSTFKVPQGWQNSRVDWESENLQWERARTGSYDKYELLERARPKK